MSDESNENDTRMEMWRAADAVQIAIDEFRWMRREGGVHAEGMLYAEQRIIPSRWPNTMGEGHDGVYGLIAFSPSFYHPMILALSDLIDEWVEAGKSAMPVPNVDAWHSQADVLLRKLKRLRTAIWTGSGDEGSSTTPPPEPPEMTTDEKIMRAIVQKKNNPNLTNRQIAIKVGCSPSTLTRSDIFQRAVKGFIGDAPPKGHVNDDGSVEIDGKSRGRKRARPSSPE